MTTVKARLLIADDDWSAREVISNILTSEGFAVETASDGEEAIAKLDQATYDLLITDLKMPKVEGIQVLQHLAERHLSTIGIVATGYGSIESAIAAMRLGAFDYLTKPFHIDEIRHVVNRALEYRQLQSENTMLKRQLKTAGKIDTIVGNHPSIHRLKDLMRTVADSDSTILILGESGTGKELVARGIHHLSDRADRPLIPVNCGAIPEDLLESELFGHVKGAFTGAVTDRAGRFQLADGGTIFLDEIGDMSPKLQVKVLRVLQEQEFEPVGSTQTVKVNVRVIAATNRDLEKDVRDRRFREDLFYRLNVIPVHLPPLRERGDDLALLADHFIKKFNKTKGRRLTHFTPEALALLQRHTWPGNVRELENLVERMAILHQEGAIDSADLPERFRQPHRRPGGAGGLALDLPPLDQGAVDLGLIVARVEYHYIQQALALCDGVKTQAARRLAIKRTTLVEKARKFEALFGSPDTD